ncbi:MAG: cell wall-active antibiotics response protein [Prevotellaceae bacterium]|jgi:predicted membrane protein|nr:cell wall-active antibiotics response protein [Prevotellaceae bacterium]
MNTQLRRFHPVMIIGIILILLGSMLIVSNIGLAPQGFNKIIFSWQMLLIVIGTVSMLKRQIFHGLSMICVGIFFIVPKIAKVFPLVFSGIDIDNFVAVYWPALLIVGGIILILRIFSPGSRRQHWHNHHKCYKHYHERFKEKYNHFQNDENGWNDKSYNQKEDFSKSCVFGNGKYIVADTEFKGGLLQAIFGGIELDLRKAHLPEGETFLHIEAIFGGVELFVPDNWLLEVKVESVLGGIDDNRRITEVVDTSRKLIIKGSAVFGGVEIRN